MGSFEKLKNWKDNIVSDWKEFKTNNSNLKWVIFVALGVVILLVIYIVLSTNDKKSNSISGSSFAKKLTNLVDQSKQWHELAKQDKDPLVKFQHYNYAIACCKAVQIMAPDDTYVEKLTSTNIKELYLFLQEEQMNALKELESFDGPINVQKIHSSSTVWNH